MRGQGTPTDERSPRTQVREDARPGGSPDPASSFERRASRACYHPRESLSTMSRRSVRPSTNSSSLLRWPAACSTPAIRAPSCPSPRSLAAAPLATSPPTLPAVSRPSPTMSSRSSTNVTSSTTNNEDRESSENNPVHTKRLQQHVEKTAASIAERRGRGSNRRGCAGHNPVRARVRVRNNR